MVKKRTLKEIKPVLTKLKSYLIKTYGNRLDRIILFGSFTENKATQKSDIDIAIILKQKCNLSKEIDRVSDFLNGILLEDGELVSFYPVSRREISNSNWPLFANIKEKGLRL